MESPRLRVCNGVFSVEEVKTPVRFYLVRRFEEVEGEEVAMGVGSRRM